MPTPSGASLPRRPSARDASPPRRAVLSGLSPLATYPGRPLPRVGRMLDAAVRDALRQIRRACAQTPDEHSAQAFNDASKGRHIGTLAIQRMLMGARRAGAPKADALQLVRAFEGVIGAIWHEPTESCPRLALEAETIAQAHADAAQVRAVLSESGGDLDAAIELTGRAITRQQALLAALVARRTLQGA